MESADIITPMSDENITSHDITENKDCLDIFVSRFPAKTQCDTIVAHILDKSNLKPEFFEVLQIVNPKIKAKYRKFTSFKIKAHDKASYDKIIDNKLWEPFAEAVPFNAEAKTKSRQRKQQKPKQLKSNQQPQHEKPTGKKQPQASKEQIALQPVVKSNDTRSRQPVVNQSRDRPLPKHKKPSHKSSHPSTDEDHRPVRPAYNGKRENRFRGGYNSYRNDHGSNFQDLSGHGSNFHGKKWNKHRPMKSELRSILSLLTRELREY